MQLHKYKGHLFDTILSINSIHYFLNNDFFKGINKYSKKNTQFIIRFLDKDLLYKILGEKNYISHNSSFVRKINSDEIKIYYEWCHNNPLIEKVYSRNEIEQMFNNNGWIKTNYYTNNINCEQTDWEKYFKCFSTIVFSKI